MKKSLKNIMQMVIFIITVVFILVIIGKLFLPNWDDVWKATPIIEGFYELPNNSIDVLNIGSSQIICGISPLEMYKDYGIISYNLGLEQQSIPNSYFWLKESLKTQKSKVIVLDVKMLFYNVTDEAMKRKNIDYMKFSKCKLETAIYNSKDVDNRLGYFLSYVFPVLRFHSRWNEFYNQNNNTEIYETVFRGFHIDTRKENNKKIDNQIDDYTEGKKYLIKIIEICKSNNINLILIRTPSFTWNEDNYKIIKEISNENNIPYIDFNYGEYKDVVELDEKTEFIDYEHINVWGAKKVSKYVGKFISENYNIENKRYKYEYMEQELLKYETILETLEKQKNQY